MAKKWTAKTGHIPNVADRGGSLVRYLGGAESSGGMTAGDQGVLEILKTAALEIIRRGAVGDANFAFDIEFEGRGTEDNVSREKGGEVYVALKITQVHETDAPGEQKARERREARLAEAEGVPVESVERQPERTDADKGKTTEALYHERQQTERDQKNLSAPIGAAAAGDTGAARAKSDPEKIGEQKIAQATKPPSPAESKRQEEKAEREAKAAESGTTNPKDRK